MPHPISSGDILLTPHFSHIFMEASYIDPQVLGQTYASETTEELLAIVSYDAHEYEDAALELARAELRNRGMGGQQLHDKVHELKANRFDELKSGMHQEGAPLSRLMFWVCLIESGTITFFIFAYLAIQGRKAAAREALTAVFLGFAIKALLLVLLFAYVELRR